MFTATERIERNGVLVAYAGETMSDEEARERGLAGGGTPAATAKRRAAASPMDERWADAAGMGLGEVEALWEESPAAVLSAIRQNLLQPAGGDAEGGEAESGEAESAQQAKPSKAELKAECDARGIKYPKNATSVQLAALIGE